MTECHAPERGILAVPLDLPEQTSTDSELLADILRACAQPIEDAPPTAWTCGYRP